LQADLDATARRVIDANHYMTLASREPDGGPRLSPVYYTAARYTDFYWISSPQARHSRNVVDRPEVELVIFDSARRPSGWRRLDRSEGVVVDDAVHRADDALHAAGQHAVVAHDRRPPGNRHDVVVATANGLVDDEGPGCGRVAVVAERSSLPPHPARRPAAMTPTTRRGLRMAPI
jgi:pyridoxamine 5'-phosphate oxidase-like protein